MSNEIEWMEGHLISVIPGTTFSKNPKTTLVIQPDMGQDYQAKVHYSGNSLDCIPQNIGDYSNYRIQVGYSLFPLPSHPGKFSKQGEAIVLCDQKGALPPLPANPTPPAPTQAPTPPAEGYAPATTTPPDFAAGPATPAGPPPVTQIPPDTTTAPPAKAPVVASVPTLIDLAIARQAILKGSLIVALQGGKPTITKTRWISDVLVDYVYGVTERITGGQHRRLEAMIADVCGDEPATREQFKEFLASEGKCYEIGDSGSLHLTDMSKFHADKVMDEWWTPLCTAWRAWKQTKKNEADPNVAPDPQSPPPEFAKPTDGSIPDFVK